MGFRFASWSLLLLHLLVVMCVKGNGARENWNEITTHNLEDKQLKKQDHREMSPVDDNVSKGTNILRLHSMDSNSNDFHQGMHTNPVHASPSSHMDHIDLSLLVFFTLKDLMVGNTMPIYFPKRDPTTSPHLLPREEANSFPFSSKQLPFLLQLFSFSQDSPQAKAMENTLRQCEIGPIKGETKFCPTSLESMVDFIHGIFGLDSHFRVITTTHLTKSTTLFQNYTVLEVPKEISAPKMVACHTMPYPYAIFYCHSQDSENKVFKVSLGGENGDRVEAVAVCHMDTSHWSRDHVSFRLLRVEPGTSHVCHFFPADHFVWVPMPIL